MRALKFHSLLAFTLLLTCSAFAQKAIDPTKMTSFNITVNYPDYTVKTQMLKDNKKVKKRDDRIYHWYNSNKIMETTGSFDGNVLHGYYKSFYMSNNLKEEGSFKYGIKSGEWTSWYPEGKIKDIIHWKNGQKNGKYKLYDELGNLLVEGNFKNDALNGKFKTFKNNNLVQSSKLKNGVQQMPKPKKIKEEKNKDTVVPENNTTKEKKSGW